MLDVIIIGAGVTGSLIAHNLSKKECKVVVIEKNADIANGASGANSAIIHSGHDPKDGTLKARFNLEGNRMFPDLCKELQISYRQIGALVVACSKEEERKLDELINNCEKRDIPYGVKTKEEAQIEEPNLSDNVTKVLTLPTTGVVSPWDVCFAAMEESVLNGVELQLNEEVIGIQKIGEKFVVKTDKNVYVSNIVINCAGVHADDISKMLGIEKYTINARRGEYYVLDRKTQFVNKIIYPVPSDKGKGVLAVPTIHGNILLGPNAEFVDDKEDNETTDALQEVKEQVEKTLKNVPYNKIIHSYAGLRPTGDTHDFVIEEDDKLTNFIHVACIESPGLASSPAIAKYVCSELIHTEFKNKENYIKRKEHIILNELPEEEKQRIISINPDYGKIICRCENISLGEIKDVIHRECGATSIDGVKKRCRPGMGVCQGGFCEPLVLEILARELKVDKDTIRKNAPGSEVAVSKLKEDL